MVLLISATPWNNSREDIYSYLALGWADHRLLADHFPALDAAPISPVLGLFQQATVQGARTFLELDGSRYGDLFGASFVQRTRHAVATKYGAAPDFPKRQIHPDTTPASAEHDTFYGVLDDALERLNIPYREPFAAMQRALSAAGAEDAEAPPPSNLHGTFVLQLYKRAESSTYALATSLTNVCARLQAFQTTLEAIESADDPKTALSAWLREVYLRMDPLAIAAEDEADAELAEDDEDPAALRLSLTSAEEARRANLRSLLDRVESPAVAAAVRHLIDTEVAADLQELEALLARLTPALDRSEPKALQLLKSANSHYAAGHKPILVAAYADTAFRVFLRLRARFPEARIGLALGGGEGWVYNPQFHDSTDLSDSEWRASLDVRLGRDRRQTYLAGGKRARPLDRDDVLAAFAPTAQGRGTEALDEVGGEIDILVGSEAISVGQNLQDSTALIHLDLPWNPMVLEQRIGRVDRRGGGREAPGHADRIVDIHYCWSPAAVEAEVQLRERLKEKIRGALRDTHFDELLLAEVAAEVGAKRDEAEQRQALTHILGERQRELVEARERVDGTDDLTGSEMDGLRRLSEWTAPDGVDPPSPVVAAGQLGALEGAPAQWLVTLKMTPIGASGSPVGDALYAHAGVPHSNRLDLLRSNLDAVVAGLRSAVGGAPATGLRPRDWSEVVKDLDRALQAARARTLDTHNAEIRATVERRMRARGPAPASEGLQLAAKRARDALIAARRRDPRLKESEHDGDLKRVVKTVLEPQNAWRLLTGRDEETVRAWLDRIAMNPRRIWDEDFEEVWAALFEGVDLDDDSVPITDEPEQLSADLARPATDQTWADLRIEVVAASFVRD
jgi:hypothetical protein